MHPSQLRIEDYTYNLPDDKVAKNPLPERDASKLLIYRNGNITEDTYRNIATHIPPETLLVFNKTRVVHARLLFKKESGGVIEAFCLEPYGNEDIQTAMLHKGKAVWECLVGGASKWKHGLVLQQKIEELQVTLYAKIAERLSQNFVIELSWDNDAYTFAEILQHAGKVPLPPYLHREAEVTDKERYQTVFAKEEGSVAAPTAGLHFTPHIFDTLASNKIDTAFVTLHVGAGTFKPVKSETMQEHDMHAEWIDVDRTTIQQLADHLETGIVAVGTTSLRTMESLYWIGNKLHHKIPVDMQGIAVTQWEPYETPEMTTTTAALQAILNYLEQGQTGKLVTRTQILIAPGYELRLAKGIVTNFHQSQSTLLLLIAAIVRNEWKTIYQYALDHAYRFLSYGDGCLLWK